MSSCFWFSRSPVWPPIGAFCLAGDDKGQTGSRWPELGAAGELLANWRRARGARGLRAGALWFLLPLLPGFVTGARSSHRRYLFSGSNSPPAACARWHLTGVRSSLRFLEEDRSLLCTVTPPGKKKKQRKKSKGPWQRNLHKSPTPTGYWNWGGSCSLGNSRRPFGGQALKEPWRQPL